MSAAGVAAALGRTIEYAIAAAVGAFVVAALLPKPANELFATIAYLAAVLATLALGAKRFLPNAPVEAHAPAKGAVYRTAYATVISVTLLAMVGAAMVSKPSAEGLAALAYVGLVALAILIAVRCWSRARG